MSTPSKSPKPKGKERVCVFCEQGNISEETYGKLISKAGVTAHYFCMLFSSGLSQNGKSEKQGILGFLPNDIMKEVKRGARLKCSYCKKVGATIGCVLRNCKKMFHLGCGRDNNTLHQYFGTFSSFCPAHRNQQDVPSDDDPNIVCSICMNTVTAKPSNDTIRAPCCSKYWYHRDCVQRYATSAGLYFFKCPLCNNKDEFQNEMLTMGIYIPDQDASWEKEPHAFHELLERYGHCDAPVCKCAEGRKYDKDGSKWEIILCEFCGSHGAHVACNHLEKLGKHDICKGCKDVDEKTREEEYLLHSPPNKRKSLELLQLELASSPEASKGASPYPGPSSAVKKLGLPMSPTANAKKGKRYAGSEARHSMAQAKKSRRLSKASATVTSASLKDKHSEILSSSMSSQSSEESSDDDLQLSLKKSKLKKMKLENAWDVMRRRKLESDRKIAEKRDKNKNIKTERKRKTDAVKRRQGESSKVLTLEDTGRNLKNGENEHCWTNDGDKSDFSNLTDQRKDMMNKRLSLAVTKSEKGTQSEEKMFKGRYSISPCAGTSTVSGIDKNKKRKLKRESLENDKGQTTLTNWLKPKTPETKIKPPAAKDNLKDENTEQALNRTPTKGGKKPVIMEWKGKQLLIRSPRVLLRRSRSRNVVTMKPKCLEIDMTDDKGSVDWKNDIDLLSNIESDVRVTRTMVDIDQIEVAKISAKKGKQSSGKSSTVKKVARNESMETKVSNANDKRSLLVQEEDEGEARKTEMYVKTKALLGKSVKNERDFGSKPDSGVDIHDTQVNMKREDSPAKNLRVRTGGDKTKTKLVKDQGKIHMDTPVHANDKISVKFKHQNSAPINIKNSPAKSLRPRHKKDKGKNISIEEIGSISEHYVKENELTPTLQTGNCFNFAVQKDKSLKEEGSPYNGGSPLIKVKDSSQFGSVILINDTYDRKVNESVDEAKISQDNLERLKMYKPVALSDSPAKNLRKRSHQADSTKEINVQKEDSDNDRSVSVDHLERLKKYRPKVDYMNFSDTGQSFASIDQAAIDNKNNALKESQTFTKCVNKQKDNVAQHASVLWHLEGTRQLINESVNVVTKPHDFGCENTCPNLQSATKGGNSAQGTIKSTQSRGLDYSNILGEKVNELSDKLPTSVTKVYSSNEQNSVADYPPQTLLTKHIRSGSRPESLDSVFSNNPATKLRSSPRSLKKMSSSAYKNTHMQNNVSLGEYKEVSVDPIMSQTSFPDKSVPNKNDAQ
ncbi:uncharacterized protein LOC132725559 [Ruditapes philippinarum]|uniref:uncharacterized protein LOC132725559 n=1 Tax=Ruditapes philippinarum TaxID=129788 RepID=UPI00295B2AB6|nr:uncharacterized protein LOC132725559 [Ruditapes philippinarum]